MNAVKVFIDYAMHDQRTKFQKVYIHEKGRLSNQTMSVQDLIGRRIIAVEKDDQGMTVLTLELNFRQPDLL